jgi:hypothetical protein
LVRAAPPQANPWALNRSARKPPKLLRRLPLPLSRDVLGDRMDGALEQDADQQVWVRALVAGHSDEFCQQPGLIRCGCGSSFSAADQIIDCLEIVVAHGVTVAGDRPIKGSMLGHDCV